ncbi:MAG: hypothetical protein JWN92_285, partial [Candidatus Acidoferrum typicum]|nr:hypothetical protein [Candidatus Acidoferrum typicum]
MFWRKRCVQAAAGAMWKLKSRSIFRRQSCRPLWPPPAYCCRTMISAGLREIFRALSVGFFALGDKSQKLRAFASPSLIASEFVNLLGGAAISWLFPWESSELQDGFLRCEQAVRLLMPRLNKRLRLDSFPWTRCSSFIEPDKLRSGLASTAS